MTNLRRALCTPIPAIFDAAERLIAAMECHKLGDAVKAEEHLRAANSMEVWAYTDQAWGKGSLARYAFSVIENSPVHFALADRPKPRMPSSQTCRSVIARDGYHCRFCGIPVIHPTMRRLIQNAYPEAVSWGSTNETQHAAFQCMWLQFDHVVPNGRGGDSSLDNIVIACAPCNFGRMNATIEEARLVHPLLLEPQVIWHLHDKWDGLERFRSTF